MTANTLDNHLALIAAENGWDYVPASDEGLLAIENYFEHEGSEENGPIDPAPPPKVNKRALRTKAIREAIRILRDETEDLQTVCNDLWQDDSFAPLYEGKSEDEAEEYIRGILTFAEKALGLNQF